MAKCKLTPEAEVDILNLVGAGNTLSHAAKASGVSAEAAREWVSLGKDGKEPYASFVRRLEVAEAKAITGAVDAVREAAKTEWRAAKFHLEYMEKRRASPATVAKQLEEILQVVEEVLGADEAKKVLRAIIERAGGEETGDARAALRLVTAG